MYFSQPLERPSASLSLLMMLLSSLSHQRVSLTILAVQLVVKKAQTVGSHLDFLTKETVSQAIEAPVALANFQQLSKPCPLVVE